MPRGPGTILPRRWSPRRDQFARDLANNRTRHASKPAYSKHNSCTVSNLWLALCATANLHKMSPRAQNAHDYSTHDSPDTVAAFTVDVAYLSESTCCGRPAVLFERVARSFPPDKHGTKTVKSAEPERAGHQESPATGCGG